MRIPRISYRWSFNKNSVAIKDYTCFLSNLYTKHDSVREFARMPVNTCILYTQDAKSVPPFHRSTCSQNRPATNACCTSKHSSLLYATSLVAFIRLVDSDESKSFDETPRATSACCCGRSQRGSRSRFTGQTASLTSTLPTFLHSHAVVNPRRNHSTDRKPSN